MSIVRSLYFFILLFFCLGAKATTWDEPWHDKVVKQADFFIFAKITARDSSNSVTITIINQFGGNHCQHQYKYPISICLIFAAPLVVINQASI